VLNLSKACDHDDLARADVMADKSRLQRCQLRQGTLASIPRATRFLLFFDNFRANENVFTTRERGALSELLSVVLEKDFK